MGRRAAAGVSLLGAHWRGRPALPCPGALLAGLTFPQAAHADDPSRARRHFRRPVVLCALMLKLAEDVESDVTNRGSIT